jgi:hypothetical protein
MSIIPRGTSRGSLYFKLDRPRVASFTSALAMTLSIATSVSITSIPSIGVIGAKAQGAKGRQMRFGMSDA